ncbi:hypothetical protein P8452_12691 [Trifolium repens]|nr:hypothetical protein P8452_12691 [Trifolium repens]
MSSSSSPSTFTELIDDSHFESLLSPDDHISICGFGSLLSERSARSTFPDLINFRIAKLNHFRRVFAHVAPVFFERGIAKPETMEISSLKNLRFQILSRGRLNFGFLLFFLKRLMASHLISQQFFVHVIVMRNFSTLDVKETRKFYFSNMDGGIFDKIWRDDVFPCRVYLRHCVLAAKNLGDTAYNNFLDHTYLGDRKTTIREYLANTGSGIMEEEPPESLKFRYGG